MTGRTLPTWWQLSFADGTGFLGGYGTRADDFLEAYARSIVLDINPGGEVKGIDYTASAVDPAYLDRLLTRSGVEDMPQPTGFVDFVREQDD